MSTPTRMTTQGPRYALVSGASVVADWAVWLTLVQLGTDAVAAQAVSRVAGGATAFALHKTWTFERGERRGTTTQVGRFLVLYVASYVLSLATLALWVDVLGIPEWVGKLLADGTCFVFNFVSMRTWVFRDADADAPREAA
jgi:putative flippase GtrA